MLKSFMATFFPKTLTRLVGRWHGERKSFESGIEKDLYTLLYLADLAKA
jgi:hypothetical protein